LPIVTRPARSAVLEAVEAALTANFGHAPQRASVSFVGVEPLQVLRYDSGPDEQTFVTLGLSANPMTAAQETIAAADGPRAELLLTVRSGWSEVWRALAVLAASPAVEGVVYSVGSTVDTGAPLAPGSRCTGALIAASEVAPVVLDSVQVDVLSLLAATSIELGWCRVHGAPALRERWAEQGTDLRDLARPPARLD